MTKLRPFRLRRPLVAYSIPRDMTWFGYVLQGEMEAAKLDLLKDLERQVWPNG